MESDLIHIKQLQNKNQDGFSELYDKYSGAIYMVILKMIRNEVVAQELLQDTFMTVWNKSHQYNSDKGRFYTWVYRIARNKTLNHIRKEKNLIQTEDLGVYTNKEESVTIDPENPELQGRIKQLQPHHQKAIELVYFSGLTHREAHKELDVPLGTFKSYVQQALRELRNLYKSSMVLLFLLLKMMQ
ncbi:RNA polymerase sigma factor [Winogradskyella maritima]|uniref:RNA polymerase sigma factor n=1 Tax=Winogradskyella maritima TaxID=1517766 RepID=A0ABV8AN19_9FLAO|nr:RNA polymerase sigma factor [Winogradskyella maritima]